MSAYCANVDKCTTKFTRDSNNVDDLLDNVAGFSGICLLTESDQLSDDVSDESSEDEESDEIRI